MNIPNCGPEPEYYKNYGSGIRGINPDYGTWSLCKLDTQQQLDAASRSASAAKRASEASVAATQTYPNYFSDYTPPSALETFWHNNSQALILGGIVFIAILIVIAFTLILNARTKNRANHR